MSSLIWIRDGNVNIEFPFHALGLIRISKRIESLETCVEYLFHLANVLVSHQCCLVNFAASCIMMIRR